MGVESYELKRADSICPTPESELLESVANNETNKIRSLVRENPRLISTIYGHPYNRPILYIACYELAEDARVLPSTVQILIDLGADLHYSDPADDHKEAIHFATLGQNPSILEVILRNIKGQGIDSTSNGNTALNLLVKQGQSDSKDFEKCLKLLLLAGVNVNKADAKNVTPILWAAQKGYRNAVEVILSNSSFVDVDTHKIKQKTARQLIQEKGLYAGDLPEPSTNNNEGGKDVLFRYVREGKEDEFVRFPDLGEHVDDEEEEGTLLQAACFSNRRRIVSHLIEHNASTTKRTQKNRAFPMEIAADRGFHKIFGALVRHHAGKIPDGVLPALLVNAGNHSTEEVNHRKCLEILLDGDKVRVDVNARDASGNTCLHYATRYADADTTLNLLKRGASLGNRNRFGFLPVEDIDSPTLEEHFDGCISTEPKTKFDKQGTVLTFDYKTLLPTSRTREEEAVDVEASRLLSSQIQDLVSETEVVHSISRTPELRHLLKHPLITSFLYIKWHRMRSFFYTNLAFYVAFCLSLALYIFLIYSSKSLADRPGFSGLLTVLLVSTFIVLAFRELFQIIVSPRTYFLQFENWLEITLVLVTSLILFLDSPQPDTVRQLSSTAILLAALEMMLLIGQHPQMSTNIVMLRTVSYNFFKFLLWYAILILAFALSFYTLFNKPVEQSSPTNSTDAEGKDEPEQDFFVDPSLTVIKTIVMLTGEFDASSINFDSLPNRIIFLLFVFMIAIILFNLLNGLAVSDTQMIKSDAEIIAHVERINHIVYIEKMMLGNLVPANLLLLLRNLCCCFQTNKLRSLSAPRPLAKLVCLFPGSLEERRLQVFLNQEGKVMDEIGCFNKCGGVYMDKKTIKRVKSLLQVRQVKQRVTTQDELLKQKEDIIRDLQQIIKSQQETISRLTVN